MSSTVTIIVIVVGLMEVLIIVSFSMGYLVGLHHRPKPHIADQIMELDSINLDPVSPEEQNLLKKLEKETVYGFVEEKDED